MPVQQPPITGDPQQDSFNQQVADALNTMPLGNVITEQQIIGTDIAGAQGIAGEDGFNRATVAIYQRTAINDQNGLTAPAAITNAVTLQYTYDPPALRSNDGAGNFTIGPPWEGWFDFIPQRDPLLRNDYIWTQVVNIADRGPTDLIAANDWSAVTLIARPGIGALRAVVEHNLLVDGTLNPTTQTYEARITHIYLGEQDVTAQINAERICWLIAEDDGTFAADSAVLVDDQLPATYSDRNFQNGVPRRTGFTATFPATDIFAGNTAAMFSEVSRDIEPRIEIGAVVNI